MDDQNKNLILATGLSFLVILVWFVLFPPPETTAVDPTAPLVATENAAGAGTDTAVPIADATTSAETASPAATLTETALADAARVAIDTESVKGSISLLGGRIDELAFKNYTETLDEGSDIVTFLSPVGTDKAFYALYGWAPGAGLDFDAVPGANTLWTVEYGNTLSANAPVQLVWDNGAGLTFRRKIEIDDQYMFTITQSIENNSASTAIAAPYGVLARHGVPADLKNFFILHEGLISLSNGELAEIDYDDVADYDFNDREGARAEVTQVNSEGWIGFTDHYWMATLIPDQKSPFKSVVKYDERRDIYQTQARLKTQTVVPGATVSVTTRLFAGAKEWATIRAYENEKGVTKFIDSIDWGWFFFLTKPIFAVLHYLNGLIGNMGFAIIGLTLLIKALLFPLAYKSYVSMAKMKELQPKMEELKKAAGDDKQKIQKDMMELYKKEKVNPASGCLPILLQIPIFFSLYKVIFVTMELRQAPFIGWITDLSQPDPSSILNLFGLLNTPIPGPESVFAIVSLGLLPILLGISMWLQQKLNPAPTDATQAMIFAWMPWVFMFMLGQFASGLVVYWIANNTITFTQQYLIMRSQGFKPDVFGNIISSFKKKPKPDAK
ncbi:MAG: membrane protein insertase YidC [Rhodobacterales bacterium]|nr:membrane protein insertase YidC [Rhodobacterales bacterium]